MNWLLLEASARYYYYYFTLWELRLTYGKQAVRSLHWKGTLTDRTGRPHRGPAPPNG